MADLADAEAEFVAWEARCLYGEKLESPWPPSQGFRDGREGLNRAPFIDRIKLAPLLAIGARSHAGPRGPTPPLTAEPRRSFIFILKCLRPHTIVRR